MRWGGGITRLRNNAFTLIELLAIIVILAIIAVITVPIILNIIENSRKGAASDSAYGYKDAVNKAYIQELAKPNNGNLKLDGTYVVQNDGTLNAETGSNFGVTNYTNLPVQVSGTIPSAGELHYSNNTLQGGCLVIGDYQVTFNGNEASTVKGDCSEYEYASNNVETWDKYYYLTLEPEYGTIVTTQIGSDWGAWVQKNTSLGKLQVCGAFSGGTVCTGEVQWDCGTVVDGQCSNSTGNIAKLKAAYESKGATCSLSAQDLSCYDEIADVQCHATYNGYFDCADRFLVDLETTCYLYREDENFCN